MKVEPRIVLSQHAHAVIQNKRKYIDYYNRIERQSKVINLKNIKNGTNIKLEFKIILIVILDTSIKEVLLLLISALHHFIDDYVP